MLDVTIKLSEPMLLAVRDIAASGDATPGHVIRQAIAAEIQRVTRNAKTPNRADELLLAPLRALLAHDFGVARSWSDLQSRLNAKGYTLREAGGGLAIHSHPEGVRMCKGSELGHGYSGLIPTALKGYRFSPFTGCY